MPIEETSPAPLSPRIALLSIACFWLFYFTIWSLRGALIYQSDQLAMLGTRAIVSLGSAGLTVIFWLLMRQVAAGAMWRSIGLALFLAAPAAIGYSSWNWFLFAHVRDGEPMEWNWSAYPSQDRPAPAAPAPPVSGLSVPAPPAPPLPPGAMPMGVGAVPLSDKEHMTPLQSIADQAGNGYFFFIAWASLYLALSYAAEIGALERRTATLRAAAQSAELRALRYQVNPHFLFNTLNSLSSLVLAGRREQAEQMIINLATFFRTSLTGDPTEDVPLSEEIALQELYLQIERVRFPERLLADIDVPEHLRDACIPGLILQPLVENAVKYGVSRARRAVTIRIRARSEGDRLTLIVEDDGDPLDPDTAKVGTGEAGTGVGLRNVRDRLLARFGDQAICRWGPRPNGGFAVTLTLPLVYQGC